MPLNPATMATELRAALIAEPATGAQDNVALTAWCEVTSQTIIAHLIANGLVTVVGTSPSGPVTGTGTIT